MGRMNLWHCFFWYTNNTNIIKYSLIVTDSMPIWSPCLKFKDIFCFCVENLCGHQTIGWLVKFRGRTFESFFDINMRCIKILILVLVWQSTKKHICIVSDKISEIDKHVVSWIVLLWLIDVLPHLDLIYSLQYRLDSNV